MSKTLSELLIEAENAKKELNAAILSDSFSQVAKCKATFDKSVKDYNELAVVLDFITLRSKSEPMKAAIEQLEIATIKSKENKDKDTGTITYTLEPATKQVDLVAFDEFCQREKLDITPDRLWKYKVEKFCLLVTYKVMKDFGLDTKKLESTYYISDVANQIDMGKTPTSNTAMLKQLQTIVDAMIYEAEGEKNTYKATSHDVKYIVAVMTRRSKSKVIAAPNPSTMHTLVMDVLNRIITDGAYSVDYVTKKQAKND
jgi:hypothetical protein